jgi:hypothetical protein
LKLVGDQLSTWALIQKDDATQDVFGRSAFNRYYYAAFLVTRAMLSEFDTTWKKQNHSSIPVLLTTGLKKRVKTSLIKNVKAGLMTEGEKGRLLTSLSSSTSELSNLLLSAYSLRCVADYEPEELIALDGQVIRLQSEKLTSAQNWPDKANSYCKTIRRVWKEAGLG